MDKLSPGDGKVYWEDILRTRQQDIAMKEPSMTPNDGLHNLNGAMGIRSNFGVLLCFPRLAEHFPQLCVCVSSFFENKTH
eukprot:3759228-Amphidinium_carterae.1